METEITKFIEIISYGVMISLVVLPTMFGYMIWNKLNRKGNPKIKMLEDADQEIVDGTNEALNVILERLDVIEASVDEIKNERKEVQGFRSTK